MSIALAMDAPLAFGAGLLTIAAPCILPMLPFLLGASVQQGRPTRPLFIVLGFIGSFTAFVWLFSIFSETLGLSQELLRQGAILLLGVFGVLMCWPRPLHALTTRLSGVFNYVNEIGNRAGAGNVGGLVLGASMGVVWTPCAGPALGAILALVTATETSGRAALLLLCYAAGAGIPMLAIAYGGRFMVSQVKVLSRYSHRLQMIFGVLIILAAIAMYFQYDTVFAVWLTSLI